MNSMPLSMKDFQELVKKCCSESREHLESTWVAQCANIISNKRETIEACMPQVEVSCKITQILKDL